jgi:cytochrome b561
MMNEGRQGYSGLQITLHWLIAALVLFQLVFGESMGEVAWAERHGVAAAASDLFLAWAHYWVGIAVIVLVATRLGLRLVQGAPEPIGNRRAAMVARLAHAFSYLLLLAVPVTGLMAVYVSDEIGDIHTLGQPLFIAFLALHVLGAIYHHVVAKDDTLRRMLMPRR